MTALRSPDRRPRKPASPTAENGRPLNTLTVAELRALLADARDRTAASFRRTAEIVAALEAQRADLSDLDPVWLDWMRRIGSGQLLPEMLERSLGLSDARLRTLFILPVCDQRKVAEGRIEVAIWSNGKIDKRLKLPVEMSADEFHRVFGGGRIRTFQEQRTDLEKTAPPAATPYRPRPVAPSRVAADPKAGTLLVDHKAVPIRDVLKAIGDTAPPDDGPRRPAKPVPIDADYHDALSRIAATGNTTVRRLVERAIVQTFFPEGIA